MLALENLTIKDLIDWGTSGMLLFFVYKLWQRMNFVIDKLFGYLEDAKAERKAIAAASGMDTQDLSREVRKSRVMRDESNEP